MDDHFERGFWTVVTFDICSSSMLVEDLTLTHSLEHLSYVLNRLKDFLGDHSKTSDMIPYKFLGDGWILLFPAATDGGEIFTFLTALSQRFHELFRSRIQPHLQHLPKVMGLTFGIDTGELFLTTMFERPEYIGRPLVVACRLQSAIKDKDRKPQYKVLCSRTFRERNRRSLKSYTYKLVTRVLRNIIGGEWRVIPLREV